MCLYNMRLCRVQVMAMSVTYTPALLEYVEPLIKWFLLECIHFYIGLRRVQVMALSATYTPALLEHVEPLISLNAYIFTWAYAVSR